MTEKSELDPIGFRLSDFGFCPAAVSRQDRRLGSAVGWILFLLALVVSGCATAHPPAVQRTGDPIADGNAFIAQGPARDRVLWQYRTAAAALRRGLYEEARTHLDSALASVEGVMGANDPQARRARGYFVKEAKKTFLGEPYERVMAYYYRGILYWRDGELDNARACFRSGQVHDADTEQNEYAADYVLLDYLDGLATARLGGDGADAFTRAAAAAKIAVPPAYDSEANVLFFLEYGQGPSKYATGAYGEQLRFRPGASTVWEAQIKVDRQRHRVGPYDDLSYQATTRGGRVMDHVLANKAVFKSAADTVGDAAVISGAILAGNRNTQEAGLGVLAFGLVSKIVAASTTPEADVRAWDNLPQFLSFSAIRLPPGPHAVSVEFLDKSGQILLTKTLTVDVPAEARDTVVFVSEHSITPQKL